MFHSRKEDAIDAPRPACLMFSCEHGGHQVPTRHAELFAGQETLLASHRGWDPGALTLAKALARTFDAPLHASTTTRLLVDLNRSPGHAQQFSEVTRKLPPGELHAIASRYYAPHRQRLESAIAARVAAGDQVIHIASHSFTPVLDGTVRRADVAWLYDPRRRSEFRISQRWRSSLQLRRPDLQLRCNYPYRGRSDGLTMRFRRRFSDESYVGIELEVNQRFAAAGGREWQRLRSDIIGALGAALDIETQSADR